MYDSARFFTITGDSLGDCDSPGSLGFESAALGYYAQYKPPPHEANGEASHGPPLASDAELLDRARRTKDPRLKAFPALFDRGEFAKGSHSEADFHLCCILAFWFNRDPAVIGRVFRLSKLMRDKWDETRGQTTYGDYTIANAIAVTGEVYVPVDPRPIIDLTADFHLAVDAASLALTAHEGVFRRVHDLVRVIRHRPPDRPDEEKGLRRAAGTPLIAQFDVADARTMISRVARFRRWNRRDEVWERKVPTKDIAEAVLGERDYPGARELVGIIEAPTLRPDGSLLDTLGYDRQTGLLYIPNAIYPAIPDAPTKQQVDQAKDELLYLVVDFPFKGEEDRAAWLASVLTLISRGAIDGPVPGILISSNLAGTGKSWLATLAGMISSGRFPAMDGYATDPIEMEKVLTTLAMAGDRCVVFDNAANGSAIGSTPLDRAIMARGAFRGRILGRNQHSPDVPWAALVYVTGNNIHTREDSLRRFLPSFLEYPDQHPETRDPKKYRVFVEHGMDLSAYVIEHRPRLVAAALTILRGYLTAGVEPAELTPMDFPEWDRLVRQAVYYATGHDPAGSRPELASEDETLGERVRLVNGWVALCKAANRPEGMTVEDAVAALAQFETEPKQRPIIDTFSHWARRGFRIPDMKTLRSALRKNKNAATPYGKICTESYHAGVVRWVVK